MEQEQVRAGWWKRWVMRWMSWGGAVTAIGLGNLVAALNWNAIQKGFAQSAGAHDIMVASAEAASQRYAIFGFALLIIGQQMVTRRALDEPGR
ncbi:hypothetical protein [Cellulomonas sp. SLBN-39]|uniref:hypothetical protein n=1 Tax=Cellulomonas sp. SLBN-39 TaxID=2768446 RepID=UPI00115283DC|nr:hypothetical protein [Cellulomonas sp. SLBN-39]TQL02578.1 hypothetical protein FBY24_1656 [Cellulomonas sp. SLBN-39]